MRFWLLLSISLCSFNGFTAVTFPEGCQAVVVQGEEVMLHAKHAKLVFLHNVSDNELWLTHSSKDIGMNAGWASRIQADHWSALRVDQASFNISCIESRPGHEQAAPCEGLVSVCHWPKVTMPGSAQGTFWVAEDLSLPELTAAVGGRGFTLPVNAIK